MQTYQQLRARFAQDFPKCIAANGGKKSPIMLGLKKQIGQRSRDVHEKDINYFLQIYTVGVNYWSACIEGADRLDLEGNRAGQVTASEAAYAAGRLADLLASRGRARRKILRLKTVQETAQIAG